MRRYLTLSICLFSLSCFAQPEKGEDASVKTIFGTFYKNVKHMDRRINYHAQVMIGGCNYEVLINDYPVDRYFGPANGSLSGSVPINIAILRPGLQTWKIRVYPVRNRVEKQGKVTLESQAEIQDGARVALRIEGIRFKVNGDVEKRFGKVMEFSAPLEKDQQTGQSKFADAGQAFVEYSGTFQADVPYELPGWSESEDLTKTDTLALKQALVDTYQQFASWLQEGDLEQMAVAKLKAEEEKAQAYFYDERTNKDFVSTFIERWGQPGLQMQPLENFKLSFYGDGKLVTLTDVIDGGSPLWGNYKLPNGAYKHNTYFLYFHRPKGKQTLQIIR